MTVFRRGKSYCYDFWYQGQRYRDTIGPVANKTEAKRIEAKIKGEVIAGKYDVNKVKATPLFDRFTDKFLENIKPTKNYNTYRNYCTAISSLSKAFSGKKLSDINAWAIEKYKSDRIKAGIKPSSVSQNLKCLRHMLNTAVRWGELKQSPFKGVKLFRETNGKMRILSYEEEASLFEFIRGSPRARYLEPIVVTALNSGLRAMEILLLAKDNVNFKDSYIRLEHSKNGEARIIPMNEQLTETLKSVTSDIEPDGYIFSKTNGKPYSYNGLRKAFDRAVKEAGIKDFTFHDLRHTFATRLVMAGVDIITVQQLLGHKTIKMTLRYSHPTPEHKKQAVKLLDKVPTIFPTQQEKKIVSLPQKAL